MAATATPPTAEHRHYALSDDLARLSLPTTFADSTRKLAYVNSICFLFLLIGVIGLNPPKIIEKPLSTVIDIVPVVFTPPEETPPQQETPPDEPPDMTDTPVDQPQVVTVVVPNSPAVAFAIPVQGQVAVAQSVRFATPPPPGNRVASGPQTFIPGTGEGGTFPWPNARDYPREALSQRAQGTVTLFVVVDPAGVPTKVEIKDSSGFNILDRASQQWVKNRWRWLPGAERQYYVPFQWRMQ